MKKVSKVDLLNKNLIQVTMAMLALWVGEQKEMFVIGKIYLDPRINKYLCADIMMINVLREALEGLGCETVKNGGEFVDAYLPPHLVNKACTH